MLGCTQDERYSVTSNNKKLLIRIPTCEKHLLRKCHTLTALDSKVVAHFGPQKKEKEKTFQYL